MHTSYKLGEVKGIINSFSYFGEEMSRLQIKLGSELIGQRNHRCPRCAEAGFRGYLIFGLSSAVCLNCGFGFELAARGERLSQLPAWLYDQRHEVGEL